MPLVILTYKRNRLLDAHAQNLATMLPALVAQALTTGPSSVAGHLIPVDVEVVVKESGPDDVNMKDLSILILANDFEERRLNLDQRRDKLIRGVQEFLHNIDCEVFSGSIWIRLAPGSYGTF